MLPSACGTAGSWVDMAPPDPVFGNVGVTVRDVSEPPFPVETITVGCGRTTPPDVIMAGNGSTAVSEGLALGEFPA